MNNPHTVDKKRELGAYYTPAVLSQVLADWSIISTSQKVLEPSFGGCGFIDSCLKRFRELGSQQPEKNIYGVDIDPHAFEILNNNYHFKNELSKNFILDDFMSTSVLSFGNKKFDIVIGNPPYISMHNMSDNQREVCSDILKKSKFSSPTIGRNASLWAFILLHSLDFLEVGGRVAWVLPSSFLHAEYSKKLIEVYKKYFSILRIVKLSERFFKGEGALEASVIFTGEGFSASGSLKNNSFVSSAHSISDLKLMLNGVGCNHSTLENIKLDFVSEEYTQAFDVATIKNNTSDLGSIADVKIGLVSGLNKKFIINSTLINEFKIDEKYLHPIIGRFSNFDGIRHNKKRHSLLEQKGENVFLLSLDENSFHHNENIQKYFNDITPTIIASNRTFSKRKHWHEPFVGIDSLIPDAFFSYMIHHGPRMIINQSKVNCTNSIHKIFFRDKKISFDKKIALSISLLSSYSQFSAEIEGRAYGSGVLKLEPNEARKIKLIMDDSLVHKLKLISKDIEAFLRKNEHANARKLVDSVLVLNGNLTSRECKMLNEGVRILRSQRYKGIKEYYE